MGSSGHFWAVLFVCLQGLATFQSMHFPWISLSVTSRTGRKTILKDEDMNRDVSSFDHFGTIPILKTAQRCVMRASPITAIRFTDGARRYDRSSNNSISANATVSTRRSNGTLLAWGYDIASPFEIRMHAQTYLTLGHPHQRCILTGLAGDTRIMGRFLKQTALNHTIEFGSYVPGQYLANHLGEFMQRFTMGGGNRPLIGQAFICSGIDGSLFSIDPAGEVLRVHAACAGRGSALGKELIEQDYRSSNTTLDEAMMLARKIINPPSLLARRNNEDNAGAGGSAASDGEEPRRAEKLGVEFCVIYDEDIEEGSE